MTMGMAYCEECGTYGLTGYNGCAKKQLCAGCQAELMGIPLEKARGVLLEVLSQYPSHTPKLEKHAN
jgi:hypothetical protein